MSRKPAPPFCSSRFGDCQKPRRVKRKTEPIIPSPPMLRGVCMYMYPPRLCMHIYIGLPARNASLTYLYSIRSLSLPTAHSGV